MMVSCQYSFFCAVAVQSSCDQKIQEISLKKLHMELRRVVDLHQQCYYMLGITTKLSMPLQVWKKYSS